MCVSTVCACVCLSEHFHTLLLLITDLMVAMVTGQFVPACCVVRHRKQWILHNLSVCVCSDTLEWINEWIVNVCVYLYVIFRMYMYSVRLCILSVGMWYDFSFITSSVSVLWIYFVISDIEAFIRYSSQHTSGVEKQCFKHILKFPLLYNIIINMCMYKYKHCVCVCVSQQQ